jgi:Zn-dependent protease with chaperone function
VTALLLLSIGLVLLLAGGRLRRVRLFDALPWLGVLAWPLLSFAALLSVALAGVSLVVPATHLGEGLASLLRACVYTLQAAYAAPTQFLDVTVGAFLVVAAALWPAGWVTAELVTAARQRRRAREALLLVSRHDAALGASLVEADVAAAYCLPGRNARIVLTTAAVAGLDDDELAAVLAHERAHLRERHHLVVAAARGLARALPGVPLLTTAAGEVARLVELRADDVAARHTDPVAVAGALVRLAGMRAPQAALAAADSVAVLRVTRLLEAGERVSSWRAGATLSAVLLVAVAPALLAAYPALAASAADVCTVPLIAA